MRTIAVANEKGGVGKTTTIANLAQLLDNDGQRVLVLDLDPQATATENLLRRPAPDDGEGLYNALIGRKGLQKVARRIRSMKRAQITPSGKAVAEAEMRLKQEIAGGQLALRKALQSAAELDLWDTVLIDCPPVNMYLITVALAASDYLVIPTLLEPNAVRGISKVSNLIADVRETLNPTLYPLGVLPTRVHESRTDESKAVAEIQQLLGGPSTIFGSYVREDRFVPRLDAQGRPIVRRGSANAAQDYEDVHTEMWDRIKKAEAA